MNATQTRRFQDLHLRYIQGAVLSTEDLTFYQTTLAELDTQELNEVRAHQGGVELRIQELEAELSRLQERGSQLREQLSQLRQAPHVHAA
jgi:predicted nuclease with TOPRIM domain